MAAFKKEPQSTSIAQEWSYAEAFQRNRGLITEAEQEKLRNCRVAIAGMGGVGGEHLITLTRLGIGKFTIADPDTYEVANFNRQYGATISTLGRNKAEVMAEAALDINPELDIRVMPEPVGEENVDQFLDGADLFVDAFDAFAIQPRRLTFVKVRDLGIYGIGAGPVGFSTVWVTIDPNGMSFDDYFDLSDGQDVEILNFKYLLGMVPSLLQRSYMDPAEVSIREKRGPSVSAACKLATGVLALESMKILLDRGRVQVAPFYHQYDAFKQRLVVKKLWFGNRNPIQRAKLWWLRRTFI